MSVWLGYKKVDLFSFLCMIHQGSLCSGFSKLESLHDIIKTEFFPLSSFNHYWLMGFLEVDYGHFI